MTDRPRYQIGQVLYRPDVAFESTQMTCPDCLGTRRWLVIMPTTEMLYVPCVTCHRGYQSTGTITRVQRNPVGAETIEVTGVQREEEGWRYSTSRGGFYDPPRDPTDVVYLHPEEAAAAAPGLAAEHDLRQAQWDAERLSRRRLPDGEAGRHVAYLRQAVRQAKKELRRYEEALARSQES